MCRFLSNKEVIIAEKELRGFCLGLLLLRLKVKDIFNLALIPWHCWLFSLTRPFDFFDTLPRSIAIEQIRLVIIQPRLVCCCLKSCYALLVRWCEEIEVKLILWLRYLQLLLSSVFLGGNIELDQWLHCFLHCSAHSCADVCLKGWPTIGVMLLVGERGNCNLVEINLGLRWTEDRVRSAGKEFSLEF